MTLFHFCVTNQFFRMIQETIKCYILNSILEFDNECFIWIQLSNSIIKNALKFDYVFDSYHMQCIRIEVISLIDFLSCTTSCILQRYHNLALNRIIFFSSKLSQSLFVFSQIQQHEMFNFLIHCLLISAKSQKYRSAKLDDKSCYLSEWTIIFCC